MAEKNSYMIVVLGDFNAKLSSWYANDNMVKKVPCIPPIFRENKFISDFREKAELFHSLFVNQCLLIKNASVLPTNCKNITDRSLSNITFTDNDIEKIMKGLDPNKGHIKIRMPKLCGGSIYKP